jgi:hypothetical protein
MIANVTNQVSSRQAVAAVNEWLVSYVGDRFLAGAPELDEQSDLWRIPILFIYPAGIQTGTPADSLGSVGVAAVDALTGELCSRPAISEIKRKALLLYQEKCNAESSPVSSARE